MSRGASGGAQLPCTVLSGVEGRRSSWLVVLFLNNRVTYMDPFFIVTSKWVFHGSSHTEKGSIHDSLISFERSLGKQCSSP